MGSEISRAEGPRHEVDAAAKTALEDEKVPCSKYGTKMFGVGEAPQLDVQWHSMVIPDNYSELQGAEVYYRIPGVAFGVAVARLNNRLMIRSTWPQEGWLVCAPADQMQQIMKSHCVSNIRLPSDQYQRSPVSSLPKSTTVYMADGSEFALSDLPPGLQQHINHCRNG